MAEIVVEIPEDDMAAFVTVVASSGTDGAVSLEEVKEKLAREGVTFGIDQEAITQAIQEKRLNEQFVAARGKPPLPGKDTRIKPGFEEKKRAPLVQEEAERVDYRELGLIQNVNAGTVLMVKEPPTKGVPGRTVKGEPIPTTDGQDRSMPIGRNTSLSSDGLQLIATCPGFLVFEEDRINVDTVYEASGEVGVETGNLEAYGDIIVNGDVQSGFRLKATGNIEVRGTVGEAYLEADGDILIQNGVKGHGGGMIKARGDIRTKFIENGNVESEKDIFVLEAILHSKVDANGRVIVVEGKKGVIVGGRIRAKDEVNAKVIGSWNETPTEIEVGINPQVREEAAKLEKVIEEDKQKFKEIRLQIKTLFAQKEKLGGSFPDQKEALLIQGLKIQNALMGKLRKDTARLAQLQKELLAETGGKICVFDTVYPQSRLSIRTTALEITREAKYITYAVRAGEIVGRVYEEPRLEKKKDGLPQIP